MKRFLTISAVGAIAAALAATAVIASGGSASSSSASTTVSLRKTALGKTLADGHGRTLYLFEADRPNMSNCSSSCLGYWPAFTGKAPKAGPNVAGAKLGTIARAGGKRQITYAKHPLYYFAGDRKAGDTKGEGLNDFGAKWYALSASGRKIDRD